LNFLLSIFADQFQEDQMGRIPMKNQKVEAAGEAELIGELL
jgi:hypothetical protein